MPFLGKFLGFLGILDQANATIELPFSDVALAPFKRFLSVFSLWLVMIGLMGLHFVQNTKSSVSTKPWLLNNLV